MRTTIICMLALFSLTINAQNQDYSYNNPEYIDVQSSNARIEKVIINKHKTIVFLDYVGHEGSNLFLSKKTYITDEYGKKYYLKSAKGISIEKKNIIGKSGKLSYSLIFPALPNNTKSFDLVENRYLKKIISLIFIRLEPYHLLPQQLIQRELMKT